MDPHTIGGHGSPQAFPPAERRTRTIDTSALDFNTLALLLVAIVGSTRTVVTLMFWQFNHLDKKLDKPETTAAAEPKRRGLPSPAAQLGDRYPAWRRSVLGSPAGGAGGAG